MNTATEPTHEALATPAPQGPGIKPAPKGTGTWKILAIALCLSLISSGGGIALYHKFYAQRIAVVDVQKFLAGQKKLMADGKITGEQLVQSLDRVEAVLNNASPNTVVLLKDVVLRNADEILP